MADIEKGRTPTVIADDVHIVYRVNAGGGGRGSATAALSRIVRREKEKGSPAGSARSTPSGASPSPPTAARRSA